MSENKVDHVLMQDENSGRDGRRYNEWLANRPDSRLRARQRAQEIQMDQTVPTPLPDAEKLPERLLEALLRDWWCCDTYDIFKDQAEHTIRRILKENT